ncbi:putative 115 kDa protein in type-1 like protein [Argiope bruennichi]|uniref:Putative 115 kDa protein in type-1 like protein n=1 Tax=Argiope bruennichi TaxID=94029 RepID=A0A8T0FA37_ARGBR|nr:putative 115 kDa protein in type-1 like protein [Argiope bruennichi]
MQEEKSLTILIFLDIKGAFDHAWWPGIPVLLKNFAVPSNIFHLVRDFLNDRSASLTLGRVSVSRSLQRGCPQGSVSGPLLWNLIMNSLLARLSKISGCETITFADDLLICFQGKCLDDILELA